MRGRTRATVQCQRPVLLQANFFAIDDAQCLQPVETLRLTEVEGTYRVTRLPCPPLSFTVLRLAAMQ